MADSALLLEPGFLLSRERAGILEWLSGTHPIWEPRYGAAAIHGGAVQRWLVRPVYWLGSWQFACLDYYRPPGGVRDRCVAAEPYPPVLAGVVARIESLARAHLAATDRPAGWRLSTCLVNLYGRRIAAGRTFDGARVGEHRDFEPGPVASVSLGERALFDFVRPGRRDEASRLVERLWLEDSSLLLFAGDRWKRRTLHRVLRVERRRGERFAIPVEGFETRRVNLTFRFVPDAHVVPFAELPRALREDVRPAVEALAPHSRFWAEALAAEAGAGPSRRASSIARSGSIPARPTR